MHKKVDGLLRQLRLRRRTSIVPRIVLTPGFAAVALLTLAGVAVAYVALRPHRDGEEEQEPVSPVRIGRAAEAD